MIHIFSLFLVLCVLVCVPFFSSLLLWDLMAPAMNSDGSFYAFICTLVTIIKFYSFFSRGQISSFVVTMETLFSEYVFFREKRFNALYKVSTDVDVTTAFGSASWLMNFAKLQNKSYSLIEFFVGSMGVKSHFSFNKKRFLFLATIMFHVALIQKRIPVFTILRLQK